MGCILYIQLPGIFWTKICRWQDTELKSLLLLFSPESRERMASWHTVLLSDGSKDWGHPATWTCLFHLFISTEFHDLVQRDVIDEETEVQRGEESCPGAELLAQESSSFGLSECDHVCTSETVSALSILLYWFFCLLPKLPFLTYCCSVMFQYPVNKSVIRLLHFHINLRMICFCFHKNAQTRTAVVFIHIAWNL